MEGSDDRWFYLKKFGQCLRCALNEMRAWRISRKAASISESFNGASGLKVHLGCGSDVREGWVNIDLSVSSGRSRNWSRGDTAFINYDLRRGIPMPTGCAAMVYSSHFLEHISEREVLRIAADAHRIIAPGGVFRAAIPDFRTFFERYLVGDKDYFELMRSCVNRTAGSESIVDFINYVAYQGGEHKFIVDAEKLGKMTTRVGFEPLVVSTCRPDVDVMTDLRTHFSLYLEATRGDR